VPQDILVRACAHDFLEMNAGLVQICENEFFWRSMSARGRLRAPQ
jgi:hypothetical protein